MTFRSTLLLGVTTVIVLAGCGGGDGPSFAGAIDTAATRAYALDAKTLVTTTQVSVYGSQDVSTPLPVADAGGGAPVDPFAIARRFLARARRLGGIAPEPGTPLAGFYASVESGPAGVATTCIPTITGVDSLGYAIDTDGDGAPNDLKVDFGPACSESLSGLVYTYSGSYRIQDMEVGWGAYAFTATKLSTKLVDGYNGDNIKDVVNGTEHADFSAALATHSYDVTYARIGTFGGDQLSVTFDLVEDSSFDPDAGFSFTVGGASPTGELTLHLDYRAVGKGISGDDVHFVIETIPSLHYQTGCSGAFTGGTLRGLLNGSTETGFALTWAGCAAPALQMFGTTDGP